MALKNLVAILTALKASAEVFYATQMFETIFKANIKVKVHIFDRIVEYIADYYSSIIHIFT